MGCLCACILYVNVFLIYFLSSDFMPTWFRNEPWLQVSRIFQTSKNCVSCALVCYWLLYPKISLDRRELFHGSIPCIILTEISYHKNLCTTILFSGGVRGVSRVLAKLQRSIEAGNYYEAHQMYKTLYFRYVQTLSIPDTVLDTT